MIRSGKVDFDHPCAMEVSEQGDIATGRFLKDGKGMGGDGSGGLCQEYYRCDAALQ